MKKIRFLSLVMAVLLILPFAFSVVGCGGNSGTEYTITYTDIDGATATENPSKYKDTDEDFTLSNPIKKGYEFLGWTGTGLTEATKDVKIAKGSTGNRTYKANWSIINYSITYLGLDGATVNGTNPTTYNVTSSAITLINPTKADYTFTGWTGTGFDALTMEVTIPTGSIGNRNYTANWALSAFTITYEGMDGANTVNNPVSYTEVSSDIILLAPTKTGYNFVGWTGTGLTAPTKNVTIPTGSTGNRTYTANWEIATYSITYTGVDGATFATENPTSYKMTDAEITLVNPTKEDYIFTGWTGTGLTEATMTVVIATGSVGNREYHANFTTDEFEEYSITYNGIEDATFADGANPTTYNNKDANFTLNAPSKDGATFIGWTGTGTNGLVMEYEVVASQSPGNLVLTAIWEYAITYNGLEGVSIVPNNPEAYNDLSDDVQIVNPEKRGYTFEGWTGTDLTGASKSVVIAKGSKGAREYTANWTLAQYSITYTNLDGATVSGNPASYNITSGQIKLNNPTKEGFTFVGWSGEGVGPTLELIIPANSVGNRTYHANWVEDGKGYSITYVFMNDSRVIPASDIKNYDLLPKEYDGKSNITIPTPQHKNTVHYGFEGWLGTVVSGSKKVMTVTISAGTTGDITLTAYFGYYSKNY